MSAREPVLRVIAAGLQTTVQDLGRVGWGRFGVAPGGALDDLALRWANLLVGNGSDAAALELTLLGPTLSYEGTQSIVCALTGADFGAMLDGVPQSPWRSFLLRPGATLACRACQFGARGYLAVAGGVAVPLALDSRSTDIRAGLGGLGGRALRASDAVPLTPPAALPPQALSLPTARIPTYDAAIVVRAVLGPQDDRFTEDAIVTFLSATYTVTREADRMGVRLDGPVLTFRDGPVGADVISEGVATGAVQVPAHGRPIVLLAARQTTGGYAKIATIIGADLWRLGQARPGDQIRFRAVPVAEAQDLAVRHQATCDPALLDAAPWPIEQAERKVEQTVMEERTLTALAAVSTDGWTPDAVGRLLDRIAALDLAEFSLEAPGVRLHLRRGATTAPPSLSVTDAASPNETAASATAITTTAAPASASGEFIVTAPLIGVFYRSVRQGEPPLVTPGDLVTADQPLGLIEVMKTFHEVTAGHPARVIAALAADAIPVQYGDALFTLAPVE